MQEEATQIKYHLNIEYNETWFTSNTTFMPLAVEIKNNTSQAPHNQVSTPGFEMPLLGLSMILIIVFNQWRKKSDGKPWTGMLLKKNYEKKKKSIIAF